MTEPKVTINEDDMTMTIVLPILEEPQLSKTEKTFVMATTKGNFKTGQKFQGHDVTIGINAYYKNPNYKGA